jgi:hypothetical protein
MFGWNETSLFAILVGVALKGTIVLGAAWLAAFLLRGQSAAARHLMWSASAAALLALPLMSVSLPSLPVPGAKAVASRADILFRTASIAHRDTAAAQPTARVPISGPHSLPWRSHWRLSVVALWAAGSLLAFLHLLISLGRMHRMRRAAVRSAWSGEDLAHDLGIRRPVDVLDAPPGAMPTACGILHPASCCLPAARCVGLERGTPARGLAA